MYKQPENVKLICLWALLNWCSLIWKQRLEKSVYVCTFYMCFWKGKCVEREAKLKLIKGEKEGKIGECHPKSENQKWNDILPNEEKITRASLGCRG